MKLGLARLSYHFDSGPHRSVRTVYRAEGKLKGGRCCAKSKLLNQCLRTGRLHREGLQIRRWCFLEVKQGGMLQTEAERHVEFATERMLYELRSIRTPQKNIRTSGPVR
jgi:hypothetical protein